MSAAVVAVILLAQLAWGWSAYFHETLRGSRRIKPTARRHEFITVSGREPNNKHNYGSAYSIKLYHYTGQTFLLNGFRDDDDIPPLNAAVSPRSLQNFDVRYHDVFEDELQIISFRVISELGWCQGTFQRKVNLLIIPEETLDE